MKNFIKKHWENWCQTIVVIVTIICAGWIGHGVDVWRAPEAIKEIKTVLETNSVKLDGLTFDLKQFRAENNADHILLKQRQKKVMDTLDIYVTNHPPINWPEYSATATPTNYFDY